MVFLIVKRFDVAIQTKFRDFRPFEVNDLTWGHELCNRVPFAFSHNEQYARFYFADVAHLGANFANSLPELVKYFIVIGWGKN